MATATVAISIPVELAERLKRYKGRINVSRAASDGIRAAMDKLDEVDGKDATIARLMAENAALKESRVIMVWPGVHPETVDDLSKIGTEAEAMQEAVRQVRKG
jgi:post-segregation antitoxin (ccd killing protein)